VVLLRGINVGGNKRVKMEDLKGWFEAAGCSDVATYIQSGNVVLKAAGAAEALAKKLEAAIVKGAGFESRIVLRTKEEWAAAMKACPFDPKKADPKKLNVGFLRDAPKAGALADVDPKAYAPEEFALRGRELYLLLPDGVGKIKLPLPAFEKKLGPFTVRNWNTVEKLAELASA